MVGSRDGVERRRFGILWIVDCVILCCGGTVWCSFADCWLFGHIGGVEGGEGVKKEEEG